MSNIEFDAHGNVKADRTPIIAKFFVDSVKDERRSRTEGRPIYRNVEMVELRFAADRQSTVKRPAHSESTKVRGEIVTYAERFRDQYARFKANETQIVDGTPLSEAPFLSAAERSTLKALNVYTIEQLASLSGQPLKNLGPNGVAQQQKAKAYLDAAAGTANVTALAEENARLKDTVAKMATVSGDPRLKFVDLSDDRLKDYIREATGNAPRGNPSRSTLVRMCVEIDAGQPVTADVEEDA